jgi:hypothetical protein
MATATQKLGVVSPTTGRANAAPQPGTLRLLVGDGNRAGDRSTSGGRPGEYRCACGQGLRVFGLGRHQVYFEPGSARLEDPVIARACPQCGGGLPGSNPA